MCAAWGAAERRVDIRSKLACNDAFVSKWTSACDAQGLAGLVPLHPGRTPKTSVAKLEARVLNRTLQHSPKDGSTHWSSRKLAGELGDVVRPLQQTSGLYAPDAIQFPADTAVLKRRGVSRSAHYADIKAGLFPKPVAIGVRSVAHPDYEVDALNAATIA